MSPKAWIAYWDNYINGLIGPNAPQLPFNQILTLNPPPMQPGFWYNGAVSVDDVNYVTLSPNPIFEKGLGVFVGLIRPFLDIDADPLVEDLDPDTWLCVYGKVINPSRPKPNPYKEKKSPQPRVVDRRRVQLRAKQLSYGHETPAFGTWASLIPEADMKPITAFSNLTTAQKVALVVAREGAWILAAADNNRTHLNRLRMHSQACPQLPQLPV